MRGAGCRRRRARSGTGSFSTTDSATLEPRAGQLNPRLVPAPGSDPALWEKREKRFRFWPSNLDTGYIQRERERA